MQYIFITGRNPELALAEALSLLEKQNINAIPSTPKTNAFLLDTSKGIDTKQILPMLGGTIAIGKILCTGNLSKIKNFIETEEVYFGQKNKFLYSCLNFASEDSLNTILGALKQKFRKEKTKARFKSARGTILMQSGKVVAGTPSKISAADTTYFLFKNNNYSFGFVQAFSDSKETEARDMGKPVRREQFAISPRLAKILVNLSQTNQGKTLLDPFCGIGVILQEAILQGINVVGVDLNLTATTGAKKNIEWIKKKYHAKATSEIFTGDSRKTSLQNIAGIATEPSLGKLLKKIPSKKQAIQMQFRFENLMIEVLNNTKNSLVSNAKIAFTAPYINTGKSRFGCSIQKICNSTGLQIHALKTQKSKFPVCDFRPNQIVGREIFVLEKK